MAWFLQLLLLITIVASAQPDVIFLKRKIIDTRRTPIELVRSDRIQRDARGNEVARQYLIQFKVCASLLFLFFLHIFTNSYMFL